jgi:hypothetical protein
MAPRDATMRRMPSRQPLPEDVEIHRDHHWRRDPARAVTSPMAAERFVDEVGFLHCLTDARRPGPSLFIAVCGRRDAVKPRNVQTVRRPPIRGG